MSLITNEVEKLKSLIRDSFRVRENQDPVYVDIGGNLSRFSSQQHQVLFGRRGSGKSCLLVHFLRTSDDNPDANVIYIGIDEIKRLGFPDILVRLLLSIFEALPGARRRFWNVRKSRLHQTIAELRTLLDEPESAETKRKDSTDNDVSMHAKAGKMGVQAGSKRGQEVTQAYTSKKLDQLERHLQDFKTVLRDAFTFKGAKIFVLIDDFYLVNREIQPNVLDYVHRLLRGTNYYLKLATIRHRTSLRKHDGQTIGIELFQDIEEISLDKTFENFEATNNYLHAMLQSMAERTCPGLVTDSLFNVDGHRALTLASGGVPRDFLNIFVDSVDVSIQAGKLERLTPTYIYKASAALSYKNKLTNIKEDAGFDSMALEKLFTDLLDFCLREKKKTAFLVKRDDAQNFPVEHELLQQLMDFKLIHVIDSNTSAASGRSGRYLAYTLDFSLFMEPRRRNIEIVEFWRTDDQRRPIGVREAPDYPLSRAAQVLKGEVAQTEIDDILESMDVDENALMPDTSSPDAVAAAPPRN